MIEQDTIRLLRECDAGIKMGVSAIDEVVNRTDSSALRTLLCSSKMEHEKLCQSLQAALHRFGDEGKSPSPIAKTMSAAKINMDMLVKPSDATIAGLIIDGCNMGVKSLSKYLNQYAAADEQAKAICQKLITLEEQLAKELRAYV